MQHETEPNSNQQSSSQGEVMNDEKHKALQHKHHSIELGINKHSNHFTLPISLPSPDPKPRLNIQPIDPKTNEFLKKARSSRKRNSFFKISLGLLIISTLFVALASLNLYAQNKGVNQNKNIQDCKNLVNMAAVKGISIQESNCESPTGWNNLYGEDLSKKAFNSITQEISKSENSLEDQIASVDQSIATLKVQLSNLKISGPEVVTAEKHDNLNIYLSNLKTQQSSLQSLLDNNLPKLTSKLAEAQNVVAKVPNSSNIDKAFIADYSKFSQEKQIENYPKLEEITGKLQVALEVLTKKSIYPVVGNLLDFKFFGPADFQKLYETKNFVGVQDGNTVVNITGDINSDNYIRSIAEKRGYKKRPQALNDNLVSIEGYKLQINASEDWKLLKSTAAKDGVKIALVSGYRSYDDQRSIFMDGLQEEAVKKVGRSFTSAEIISGLADSALNEVLVTRSIPGYSKHHTGYTIDATDISSGKSFTRFSETASYTWLSENNYYNAKRFGYVPSYPKGGTNFGPDPESWEYIWVGVESLKS